MVYLLDINECASSPCHGNAQCTNNAGSFICACNTGYTGDGLVCLSKLTFHQNCVRGMNYFINAHCILTI